MAAFYEPFNVVRAVEPDFNALQIALRLVEPTIGIIHNAGTNVYNLKKNTSWTAGEITNARNAIINAPNVTAQSVAQARIDNFPIIDKAIILTIIDEINILRVAAGLPARTVNQAITAIRNKAATL